MSNIGDVSNCVWFFLEKKVFGREIGVAFDCVDDTVEWRATESNIRVASRRGKSALVKTAATLSQEDVSMKASSTLDKESASPGSGCLGQITPRGVCGINQIQG